MASGVNEQMPILKANRLSSGIADLDIILEGGYFNPGNIVIIGPSGMEKAAFAYHFAAASGDGENAYIICGNSSPADIINKASTLGINLNRPNIRFIDWNIYGRLDRLLIKLFYNEENLSTYVFLDCSNSMNFGTPSKFDYSRRLAAAIAYIAASNNDSVRIFCFDEKLKEFSPRADRAARVMPLFRFLEGQQTGGRSDFTTTVQEFLARFKRPGVVFVLSDLLFERRNRDEGVSDGWTRDGAIESGLKRLVYHKHDVNLLHVLTPEEIDPSYAGLWIFTDSETNERRKIFIDNAVLQAYRDTFDEHVSRISRFANQNRMHYLRTQTDVPFENLVLRLFAANT